MAELRVDATAVCKIRWLVVLRELYRGACCTISTVASEVARLLLYGRAAVGRPSKLARIALIAPASLAALKLLLPWMGNNLVGCSSLL